MHLAPARAVCAFHEACCNKGCVYYIYILDTIFWVSQVALVVKNTAAKAGDVKEHGFHPWVGKIPWRRAWQHTQVFLPRESHGQRRLVDYNSWGHRESNTPEQHTIRSKGLSRWLSGKRICLPMQEMQETQRHRFNPLIGKIPWRRKWQRTPVFLPGKFHGQRSLESYSPWDGRVGHDWACTHSFIQYKVKGLKNSAKY